MACEAYRHALTKEFCTPNKPRTEHIRVPSVRNRSNNNMVERLLGTIRERNKVMRELKVNEAASTTMDGQRIYCNFIRPQMALNGETPQKKQTESATWKKTDGKL